MWPNRTFQVFHYVWSDTTNEDFCTGKCLFKERETKVWSGAYLDYSPNQWQYIVEMAVKIWQNWCKWCVIFVSRTLKTHRPGLPRGWICIIEPPFWDLWIHILYKLFLTYYYVQPKWFFRLVRLKWQLLLVYPKCPCSILLVPWRNNFVFNTNVGSCFHRLMYHIVPRCLVKNTTREAQFGLWA